MENSLGTDRYLDRSESEGFALQSIVPPLQHYDGNSRLPLPELTVSKLSDIIRSPELFRAIFDHAPFGIVVGGSDYHFIHVNKSFCGFLGYDESELVGKDFRMVTHPEDLHLSIDVYRKLVEGGGTVRHEKRYIRKDGEIFWAQVTSIIIRDSLGMFICGVSLVENISERKRMELELKKTADALARSNEQLQQFATLACHDLREPLRTISQFMQLIEERHSGEFSPDTRDYIRIVNDSAKHLEGMVRGLLSLSRVKTSFDFQPVSMEVSLKTAVQNLQSLINENSAVIHADPLPRVIGAANQLSEIFQNLIENSIKFRSGRPPEMQITCMPVGREWHFAFQDNGVGFCNEEATKLFSNFERLPGSRSIPGCGIGLALCKRIIELHGGRIWAESKAGEGSTFFFTLPRMA